MLAAEVNARSEPPTVLLHNAGIFQRKRELTEDGFEKTMAVNHLAPFLLTHLVLADPRCKVKRIVLVSSMAHGRGTVLSTHRSRCGCRGLARAQSS